MAKGRHTGGRPPAEMAGEVFGRLKVLERAPRPAKFFSLTESGAWWRCECTGPAPKCKGEAVKRRRELLTGRAMSCGCLRSEASAARASARRGIPTGPRPKP